MPPTKINPFDIEPPFTPAKNDEVIFCTETEEKKRFLGRVTEINSDGDKTFFDIKPISGLENQFPPISLARVTRGFILRKLSSAN